MKPQKCHQNQILCPESKLVNVQEKNVFDENFKFEPKSISEDEF